MTVYAQTIALSQITRNPNQPRRHFATEDMFELAQSIRAAGLVQPIVVQNSDNGYQIVDGERRWRASMALAVAKHRDRGSDAALTVLIRQVADVEQFIELHRALLDTVHIEVVDTTAAAGTKLLIRATVANLHRTDLSPMELATSYQQMSDTGMSDDEIAQAVGKSRPSVANTRRLMGLSDNHKKMLTSGQISERQALAVLPFDQLPPDLKRWFMRGYDTSRMIDDTLPNVISDKIREHIHNLIEKGIVIGGNFKADEVVNHPDNVPPTQHVQSPTCFSCKLFYKGRCYDADCHRLKLYHKKQAENKQAAALYSQQSGIPILDGTVAMQVEFKNQVAVDHATNEKCPNLRLNVAHYPVTTHGAIGPLGLYPHVYYTCTKTVCECKDYRPPAAPTNGNGHTAPSVNIYRSPEPEQEYYQITADDLMERFAEIVSLCTVDPQLLAELDASLDDIEAELFHETTELQHAATGQGL